MGKVMDTFYDMYGHYESEWDEEGATFVAGGEEVSDAKSQEDCKDEAEEETDIMNITRRMVG